MHDFKVTYSQTYDFVIYVKANSYLESEEKADQLLSKNMLSYRVEEPDWHLKYNEKCKPSQVPTKNVCVAA